MPTSHLWVFSNWNLTLTWKTHWRWEVSHFFFLLLLFFLPIRRLTSLIWSHNIIRITFQNFRKVQTHSKWSTCAKNSLAAWCRSDIKVVQLRPPSLSFFYFFLQIRLRKTFIYSIKNYLVLRARTSFFFFFFLVLALSMNWI